MGWRKLPKDAAVRRALLERLYVDERLTTTEIGQRLGMTHKSVINAMSGCGIPRRPVGHSRHITCVEPGCDKPVYKVMHASNGSLYGKRCRLHWIVFRVAVNQRYGDRKRRIEGDETWLRNLRQLLVRARRISREVSASLKPASPPETTSPDACPR